MILQPIRGHRRGTEIEIKNLLDHVWKGCLCDPFNEMHIPKTKDLYPDFFCLRGESIVESTNKNINKLVHKIARMSADLANKKLWLWVTNINLNKDEELKEVLSIKNPQTIMWYLHKALLLKYDKHKRNMVFPNIPGNYDKLCMGIGYR